jgi:hypothetical protein
MKRTKKAKRASMRRIDRYQVENIVSSASRAEQLVNDSWRLSITAKLTPVMASAIFRDLSIEIGNAHRAAKNLAEAFPDRSGKVPA